jgi:sugar phosphate isomerase/epimerase
VADLTFDEVLDFAAETGIKSLEIPAGGISRAPHLRLFELLEDARKRAEFAGKISSRGLSLSAVNCSAWPLHPDYGDEHLQIMRASIRLASALEVDKIVAMSGCPGESARARTISWLGVPWTKEARGILEEQWNTAIEAWCELAGFAAHNGVQRIALELMPPMLVYNVPTLLRLREAAGPVIGANVDPSHFFWQQIDPLAVVSALGPAVYHVHLKDLVFNERELGLSGVLDPRSLRDPEQRSWIFRTVGAGHPASFWRSFVTALRDIGYDDVLSIENEDPLLPGKDGVREAVGFISGVMT